MGHGVNEERPYGIALTEAGRAHAAAHRKKMNRPTVVVWGLTSHHAHNKLNGIVQRHGMHFTPDMLTITEKTK